MQFSLTALVLAASASIVSAQGLSSTVSPTAAAPSGCATSYSSPFEFAVVLPVAVTTKRSIEAEQLSKRQSIICPSEGTLVATLSGSVLTDAAGRIGGIVGNNQFQFDGPVSQSGTIYNAGFSVCTNTSLALGGSTIFYQCPTNGNSEATGAGMYNLYDSPVGNTTLCQQVLIQIIPCVASGSATGTTASLAVSGISIAQTTALGAVNNLASSALDIVSQKSDGQPLASIATYAPLPAAVISQKTDGQILGSKAVSTVAVATLTTATAAALTAVTAIQASTTHSSVPAVFATTLQTAASVSAAVVPSSTQKAATVSAPISASVSVVTTAPASSATSASIVPTSHTTTSLNVIPIGATAAAVATTNGASSNIGGGTAFGALALIALFIV